MATSVRELDLTDKRLLEILTVANDWALCNGISIRSGSDGVEAEKAIPAPYSLFPSVVPKTLLDQAKSSMVLFSRLMHKVAMDHEFLEKSLQHVNQVDTFMQKLWNIYLEVREAGIKQPYHLGLFRNDFMMNCLDSCLAGEMVSPDRLELKQIEFNTIASSFGGLTERIVDLHRLTLGMAGKTIKPEQIVPNQPASGLAEGMVKAWEMYKSPRAVIMFLVSPVERNVMDQRWLEFKVYARNSSIRVLRKTFLDVYKGGHIDDQSRLIVDGDEVAVVYLRDGYTVENYSSQKEWDARRRIELSRAIKCPSVQYQLAGAKKIQQELARAEALQRFVTDPEEIKILQATFADQFSLDMNSEGDAAVQLAMQSPEKYVLKPQREGGGHNLYNNDIINFFNVHENSKERSAYILMQRIFPWQQKNFLVKSGVPFILSDVISELGVYGAYIGSKDSEVMNTECGHMMRTKIVGTDEGGIVAGFAVLDTPLVV